MDSQPDNHHIGDLDINQTFIHEIIEISSAGHHKIKLDLDAILENNVSFIEYILIIPDSINVSLDNIKLVVQADGFDLWDRMDFLYYNKIFPLDCIGAYDDETNKFLECMVKNKTNIMFIPFKVLKNGYSLDISKSPNQLENPLREIFNLTLSFYNIQPCKLNVYIKVSDKKSENIDKLSYSSI